MSHYGFRELLDIVKLQGLIITDQAALLNAARVGASSTVFNTCKSLREG